MAESIYIINGTVLTMEDLDIANGFVQVKDGKISSLGQMSNLPDTDGAEIIDAPRRIYSAGAD